MRPTGTEPSSQLLVAVFGLNVASRSLKTLLSLQAGDVDPLIADIANDSCFLIVVAMSTCVLFTLLFALCTLPCLPLSHVPCLHLHVFIVNLKSPVPGL